MRFGSFFGAITLLGFTCVVTGSVMGCSSDTTTGPTDASLSSAYASNCTRCHGPKGEGAGQFPKIPGKQGSEAAFIAYVRAGSPDQRMPSFSASQISDADLKADYLWFTTKR